MIFFNLNERKLSMLVVSAISVVSLPDIPYKQAAHGAMLIARLIIVLNFPFHTNKSFKMVTRLDR